MGLPVWRNPEESKVKKEESKPDPTAEARSPIRRRPPYARRRTPPRRDSTRNFPPRFERSPPPSVGFNGLREGRQSENRTVPPVATLLESADRRVTLPPSVAERRNRSSRRIAELHSRERQLRTTIDELQSTAAGLESQAQALQDNLDLPQGWVSWTDAQRNQWVAQGTLSGDEEPDLEEPRFVERNDRPTRGLPRSTSSLASTRGPSRDEPGPRRSALPTPPHDESPDSGSLFIPVSSTAQRSSRRSHPLSNSWRPESPVNGLGDRIRSPTPGDGWEIMRSTITPDATLPSADSSFTSAAASHSFTSGSTNLTEPDRNSSSANSQLTPRLGGRSESVSSVDPDDLCNDDDREVEADVAAALYAHEMSSIEGRRRVSDQYQHYEVEDRQRLFSDPEEPETVEIGFRLINDALATPEGRTRLDEASVEMGHGQNFLNDVCVRIIHRRWEVSRSTSPPQALEDPPIPRPEGYSENTRAAVRQASAQVHDYFRRFTADSLADTARDIHRSNSPPPRYEPLASHPHVNAFTSRDPPEAHPVSPPTARSERDVSDSLLEGNESDLEPMRRIVERLAQRDDVPDDWWMSMGLNLSRARVRSRSPQRLREQQHGTQGAERVRSGRVERGGSRL